MWITLSSVMQEVFVQPLPLFNTYFLSKRLIHRTTALWTSFFPSAKNRSRLKLLPHFYPLQGQSLISLTLPERRRMHSRLAQQESWGPNMPLGVTKHSVWLPSRSLGFMGLILQSLLRQHSHWLPQNFCLSKDPGFGPEVKKKVFSAFKCRWLMSQRQWAEVWHTVQNWLKAEIFLLFLSLFADTGFKNHQSMRCCIVSIMGTSHLP